MRAYRGTIIKTKNMKNKQSVDDYSKKNRQILSYLLNKLSKEVDKIEMFNKNSYYTNNDTFRAIDSIKNCLNFVLIISIISVSISVSVLVVILKYVIK